MVQTEGIFKMINWLNKFDDWYFDKKKGFIYTRIDKIVCYILLVISTGALIYNLTKNDFDILSTLVFFGAIGIALLIRRQAKKRGNVR